MIFWIFLHIRGQRFLWKLTKFLFARSWPETCQKHLKCCCWRKLGYFKLFRGKKNFSIFMIFWIFLHIRGQRFLWKLTKLFFDRFWPETCLKHLKWCCWRKLRYFKLFWGKKIFFLFSWFFEFFCISGVRDFCENWPSSFLRDLDLKLVKNIWNVVADVN